jgi:RNA polymerase sigma-70 factor, ECF subfamily
MDKDRELALVRECQRGDRRALDDLVRHFEKAVFNAAYRMLGNGDEAADVSQTTFMKVFANIGRYDPQYRLFSWLYRIALNESINQLKRRRSREPLDAAPEPSQDTVDDSVTVSERCDEVQAALMELDEDYRTVIVLRYFTDCSYREIGETLGLPEKTVKSRLYTARQQMKCCLQNHRISSCER